MKQQINVFSFLLVITFLIGKAMAIDSVKGMIKLPSPRHDSNHSIERSLLERRSVREFSKEAITLKEVSQLLWAAQGITHRRGFRTAPSAGALYPLELYVLVGNVKGLALGVYKYQTRTHSLITISVEDRRKKLALAALGQECVRDNAVLFVFASVDRRTTGKYGGRGLRYVHIEIGHAAQNLFLQAQALGLGAAVVGAFDDDKVSRILDLQSNERPLYLMPVGKPVLWKNPIRHDVLLK